MRLFTAAALAFVAMTGTAAAQGSGRDWTGVWRNGSNSVHIRAARCGQGMCGSVVWANAKAQADARRGGTNQLIGTQIFRNFRWDGRTWRGRVFVPDLNRTFSGTMDVVNRTTLRGSGCLLGGLGCREQTWRRVR